MLIYDHVWVTAGSLFQHRGAGQEGEVGGLSHQRRTLTGQGVCLHGCECGMEDGSEGCGPWENIWWGKSGSGSECRETLYTGIG